MCLCVSIFVGSPKSVWVWTSLCQCVPSSSYWFSSLPCRVSTLQSPAHHLPPFLNISHTLRAFVRVMKANKLRMQLLFFFYALKKLDLTVLRVNYGEECLERLKWFQFWWVVGPDPYRVCNRVYYGPSRPTSVSKKRLKILQNDPKMKLNYWIIINSRCPTAHYIMSALYSRYSF